MKPVKFASQLDPKVLRELRAYAKESDRSISSLLGEAIMEYLAKVRVRPAFGQAMEVVLEQHADLLRRLAK
jgi:hypothetical protein